MSFRVWPTSQSEQRRPIISRVQLGIKLMKLPSLKVLWDEEKKYKTKVAPHAMLWHCELFHKQKQIVTIYDALLVKLEQALAIGKSVCCCVSMCRPSESSWVTLLQTCKTG